MLKAFFWGGERKAGAAAGSCDTAARPASHSCHWLGRGEGAAELELRETVNARGTQQLASISPKARRLFEVTRNKHLEHSG